MCSRLVLVICNDLCSKCSQFNPHDYGCQFFEGGEIILGDRMPAKISVVMPLLVFLLALLLIRKNNLHKSCVSPQQ